jgi:hypothetical protein
MGEAMDYLLERHSSKTIRAPK